MRKESRERTSVPWFLRMLHKSQSVQQTSARISHKWYRAHGKRTAEPSSSLFLLSTHEFSRLNSLIDFVAHFRQVDQVIAAARSGRQKKNRSIRRSSNPENPGIPSLRFFDDNDNDNDNRDVIIIIIHFIRKKTEFVLINFVTTKKVVMITATINIITIDIVITITITETWQIILRLILMNNNKYMDNQLYNDRKVDDDNPDDFI